jgi:hypothetical protein
MTPNGCAVLRVVLTTRSDSSRLHQPYLAVASQLSQIPPLDLKYSVKAQGHACTWSYEASCEVFIQAFMELFKYCTSEFVRACCPAKRWRYRCAHAGSPDAKGIAVSDVRNEHATGCQSADASADDRSACVTCKSFGELSIAPHVWSRSNVSLVLQSNILNTRGCQRPGNEPQGEPLNLPIRRCYWKRAQERTSPCSRVEGITWL